MGCVVGQARGDFEADVAVVAGAALEQRQQQIAGVADVGDDERLVAPFDVRLLAPQACKVFGVVGTGGKRVLEDRGVRRHPRHAVLGDHFRERAVAQQVTRQVVEPQALTERGNLFCDVHGEFSGA